MISLPYNIGNIFRVQHSLTNFVLFGVILCVRVVLFFVISRICGRGNVFMVFVCLSVCSSVRTITFEAVATWTSSV